MRIVVSGGGSGGHITPIIAIAHHLQSRGNELHYIGSGAAMENKLFNQVNITMYRVATGKWRRYHQSKWRTLSDVKTLTLNIRDLFRLAWGIAQSLRLLSRLKPDRVFIKGGYVGLPVGLAAILLRIPCIIHESDSRPGLTNRLLARLTPYRLSGFTLPGYNNLGNPVREEIIRPLDVDRKHFGIKSRKPVVLVFGGSLGSSSINRTVAELAAAHDDYELIHIYGQSLPKVKTELPHYHRYEFLTNDMAHALQLADVVIARAGANTLAELAALKKLSIIIPHPSLSDQPANAAAWQEGLIILPQAQLTTASLHQTLMEVLEDRVKRQALESTIAGFAKPQAVAAIADYIINLEAKEA